ncbi:conserved Plasmodium protein, unknown function [Plasmodium knowlesi strain H]|uniref:Uncharacterized protein n=3 Tax=Plasmodium knowlesi TaxID=5850 RepID=A0A5K1UXS8_PLAKH|nr:conserved protein, unknown function [Plasmodium knowlesi strain H]OTN67207.1 Uncharacterized protein PKNOH_S07459600 [Plasmodium knowlesi]CAA9988721.1 conserved protein, unknown function [Plasmodium knowlesi strain H]SBO21671.1 conserved Plasmodium protein, unknown function [Plasmodium knowlesi strain H]SBO22029.1 conserved Plasmodium protein, unknown function [Plasmodium knowlesi strain H]VVS78195.1 conserved protein, unknown function [Plasmodium knowlesi strain H]|eukprot:XP_002259696.1 hypothetical protein, conserved in Plasmodium species [Plasmodium knowlesi strain H]
MLSVLRNTLQNAKRLRNFKLFLREQDHYSLGEKQTALGATTLNSDYGSLHVNVFFNDVSILVEGLRAAEKSNTLLFNKVRNDTRHRKRAFQKRGYWKKMHYFTRKANMMSFAFKMQNIDYEKMKKLKRGEVYST